MDIKPQNHNPPVGSVLVTAMEQPQKVRFAVICRFILCDEDEGLYEDMDIDPYNPNASVQREELKQRRQEELLGQVDFNK